MESKQYYTQFGAGAKRLRQLKRATLREIAALTGIDKNTLCRIEQGRPCRPSVQQRLCRALNVEPERLIEYGGTEISSWTKHDKEKLRWFTRGDKRKPGEMKPLGRKRYLDSLVDPIERARLGSVGMIQTAYCIRNALLSSGIAYAGTIELYKESDPELQFHEEDEFVYCLSGCCRIETSSGAFDLEKDDSAWIDCRAGVRYMRQDAKTKKGEPAVLLYVRFEHPLAWPHRAEKVLEGSR